MSPAGSDYVRDKMARIVGKENVHTDACSLATYFLVPPRQTHVHLVQPASVVEVQSVVKTCVAEGIPMFTTYDTYLPDEAAEASGIVIDFSRMREIERIDSKNLCVHLQRGVTFEQLDHALKPLDLTILYPFAARTSSVLCHAVARGINVYAARYPEVQVSNMQVVLYDGSIHRTGSHANNQEMADWKEDGGPNISKWYLGADDIFGIVVCGSIWIYPERKERYFDAFGFDNAETARTLVKHLPRMELVAACLAMNRQAMGRRFALDQEALAPWTLLVGTEGFVELSRYHRRKVAEIATGAGGIPLRSEYAQKINEVMGRPWYAGPGTQVGFYTLFRRITELETVLARVLRQKGCREETIGITYLACGLGRCVYCHYDVGQFLSAANEVVELQCELASAGAFFDKPHGELARHVYERAPAYLAHLKRIKKMMDPYGIINPGRPYKGLYDGEQCGNL